MNHPNYIDGRKSEPYSIDFNKRLKEYIKKRDNYICQNCQMTEEEHVIVIGYGLTVHHINYNKKDSNKDNLITLCAWCNSRANYNRVYWEEHYKNKLCLILKKRKETSFYL